MNRFIEVTVNEDGSRLLINTSLIERVEVMTDQKSKQVGVSLTMSSGNTMNLFGETIDSFLSKFNQGGKML